MVCRHGDSEIVPIPIPFKTDEEWMKWLGLPDTERGRAELRKLTPEDRRDYAEFAALEREILAGRIPKGVIACNRNRSEEFVMSDMTP